MIRIKFRVPDTPIWKRWTKDCDDAAKNLKDDYAAGKEVEVKDLYKRKSIKDEVYFSKTGPFHGRCAYCEGDITDFQHGDIEHFRPKKAVTDENDVPVSVTREDGSQRPHPGYFWLAYSWKNLLPSCVTCNQPGDEGIGKRNRFPLELPPGYGTSDEDIAKERPLLINPIDPDDADPEDHIGIELETGIMFAKNGSPRAEACIRIFGLNLRDQLVKQRKAALREVKFQLSQLIAADDEEALRIREEIDRMEQGEFNFTLARRAQIKKIKERLGLT